VYDLSSPSYSLLYCLPAFLCCRQYKLQSCTVAKLLAAFVYINLQHAGLRSLFPAYPLTDRCRQYKVYDLSSPSYSLLYCLPAAGITDVKLGSSYVLLIKEAVQRQKQQQQQQGQLEEVGSPAAAAAVLPLEVLSAVNGMVSR
jgi:hypothetical protein